MRKWLRKITYYTRGEYWASIDEMPLYNWIRCNRGEIKYSRVKKRGNSYHDIKNWSALYDEYLKEFGLDTRYKRYVEAQIKKAILQSDYIITKEKFKLTEIEIESQKLKDMDSHFGAGKQIEEILTWLGMFLGYKLDQKKTTVKEYFIILEQYGKANKKV